MNTLATILGITSGFALLGYHEPNARLIATSLAVDASLAPLTAIIAARRARSPTFWAIAGFAFGMWALAGMLLIRPRNYPHYPPDADAA
jgi:hypothetical protein